MQRVAQLHKVRPGVGFLDAGIRDMFESQLQLMLALLAQFDADAQVAGKIETGAEFLRWRDETAVGERGAHTGVQKPARMSGVGNEAKARCDAKHRGVKVGAYAARRPAAGNNCSAIGGKGYGISGSVSTTCCFC